MIGGNTWASGASDYAPLHAVPYDVKHRSLARAACGSTFRVSAIWAPRDMDDPSWLQFIEQHGCKRCRRLGLI